jgi:signal transduction histidine kinase
VRRFVAATFGAALLIVGARLLFWLATPASWASSRLFASSLPVIATFGPLLRSPVDFLLTSLTLTAVVTVVAPGIGRLHVVTRRAARALSPSHRIAAQVAAGVLLAALLLGHQVFLNDAVRNTTVDTLRFSLHPWNPTRLALITGLVFFQAVNVWACALLLIAALALVGWRRSGLVRVGLLVLWLAPVTVAIAWAVARRWPVPVVAVSLAAAIVVLTALVAPRVRARYRHATQAPRLLALITTILVPGLLLYPAVLYHTDRAKRALIETEFAVQPAAHPQVLQTTLKRALVEIDAIPELPKLVAAAPAPTGGAIPTESAFLVWRQTALAASRLTSGIELYRADGALVSRFALNLPEYTSLTQDYVASSCQWEVSGETAPFGSEERRMLHAERRLCEPDPDQPSTPRRLGSIVVHVMLDYRALPFLASQAPYQQMLRASAPPPDEGTRGGDVELVIYGWGLLPLYISGPGAWPIGDDLFTRVYASREPFWTEVAKSGVRYRVYVSNDRYGIYALGYPALTPVEHLERLAEMTSFCAVVYVVLIVGGALFVRAARERPRAGRALLREIRASFYRKLFLAFVLASAVPVVTLAMVVRLYFATKLHTDAEAEAARTAAVAQRVIEEFAALQQRGAGPLAPLTDDLMVLISQVIDQDVNIFEGPRLIATSERDLFASGLLSQRTPAEIYRSIRLERLPSYVGEDEIGPVRYLIAAAPVRAAGRDAILTVPLALRQREIEREIDDLNRGIDLAALLFILLGAGIGLRLAERIADPVRRLTRATRRIARGDFDARILVRSADELQRLVDAFNTMAAELKAQAAQLERTHRLEAWAEMARQVAHEIKNPLTPIQLSAEHLRRVHTDRGEPLSPVLESCVASILKQVGLLRQIAAEFSSFATSPVPRPALVAIADLLEEVVAPYRIGLDGRVRIDVDLPEDLPVLQVDRTLIGRALVNVIENALHAMPGTGVLAIAARTAGAGVRLTLADSGVGMDAEALARVFEPYFSTKTSGTGLGLTIAKRNVESSDGTIEVASERGRGTTVTLWMPAAP